MRAITLTAALLTALTLPGCSSEPETISILGQAVIEDRDPGATHFLWELPGKERFYCEGHDRYADVKDGAQVVVRDAAGKVIASGELGPGMATIEGRGDETVGTECAFPLFVHNVPREDFYAITVGRHEPVTVSAGQIKPDLRLTLG